MNEATCLISACGRPSGVPGSARGWCRAHYRRWQKYGNVTEPERRRYSWSGHVCRIRNCERSVFAHGICEMHSARFKRTGTYELAPKQKRICSDDTCERSYYGRGLCRRHYDLQRGPRPGLIPEDPEHPRLRAKLRRARVAGAQGSHTHAEWVAKLDEFGGLCAYCKQPADTKDHLTPLTRGGRHSIENIVPACRSCNSRKGRMTLEEWMQYMKKDKGKAAAA